jgi:hypothetical protein
MMRFVGWTLRPTPKPFESPVSRSETPCIDVDSEILASGIELLVTGERQLFSLAGPPIAGGLLRRVDRKAEFKLLG